MKKGLQLRNTTPEKRKSANYCDLAEQKANDGVPPRAADETAFRVFVRRSSVSASSRATKRDAIGRNGFRLFSAIDPEKAQIKKTREMSRWTDVKYRR